MPDLSGPGAQRIRALDGLASDTRSLLRRGARVRRQTADLEDPLLDAQSLALLEAAERLLRSLEERRQEERQQARQRLRLSRADDDEV